MNIIVEADPCQGNDRNRVNIMEVNPCQGYKCNRGGSLLPGIFVIRTLSDITILAIDIVICLSNIVA